MAALRDLQKLSDENGQLKDENQSLKNRIAWFENQMFEQKSEPRQIDNPYQGNLLDEPTQTAIEVEPKHKKDNSRQRGKAPKSRPDDCVTDSGLRFGKEVPVKIIEVTPAELQGTDADQWEVIGTKVSRKLAKLPASYVVLEYHLPVLKKKATDELKTTLMPEQVLEGSIADISLVAGLLTEANRLNA